VIQPFLTDHTTLISVIKCRNRTALSPGMEAERGEGDTLRRREPGIAQGTAAEGAQGAESTRRPGCGGRLDRVTGVGSPVHRLVELEVRLGLGEGVEQRKRLCFLFPCGWAACRGDRRGLCRLADMLQYSAY